MVKETSKTLTYLYRSSKQFNADLLTLENIIAFHYHFKYNAGYIVVEKGEHIMNKVLYGCSFLENKNINHEHEQLRITTAGSIPVNFDFTALKFEPIPGLFRIASRGEQIIGAGNIEYERNINRFYVYELQSFLGYEGYQLLNQAMLEVEGINRIEGSCDWEDCL